jgi:(E)-4-hydroxy-3-methylbut-2-enyl-diphosphate synthase
VPLVADIHFDWRLAIAAAEAGIDGLRINPGNIGDIDRVRAVVTAANARHIPIRVGVNGGSLEKAILEKYGSATPEALVESALGHVRILEDEGCEAIKISVKASDVPRTLAAYRLLAEKTDWPLHIGVTEAGTFLAGTGRSCVALGQLLAEGIGNTVRVSLTDKPEQEVRVGVELLRASGLRAPGPHVTSCPTCGRTRVDVIGIARRVEDALETFYLENPKAPRPHVAVMGCVVNGPGEAREADIAIAGGEGKFLLFVHGEQRGVIPEAEAAEEIVRQVANWRN